MTLYGPQDFHPGGIRDVGTHHVPATDPDGHLYAPNRRWVLVRTPGALEAAVYPFWDHDTVGVVTYEVASSCPWLVGWRFTGATVLYVDEGDVGGYPEGPILGDTRFRVHDLVDDRLQRLKATPSTR